MTKPTPDDITPQTVRDALRHAHRPLTRRALSEHFGLTKAQSDQQLKPILVELTRTGEVIRNRRAAYGLAQEMNLIKGQVSAHPDGFGFVVPEQGEAGDLYLSPKQMRQVMHGDQVMASVVGVDRRGRREGAVVEVVERAHEQVVGRLVIDAGLASVVPDDPRLTQDILIPLDRLHEASPGQIVVARITQPPSTRRSAMAEVVQVLGQADEPGIATDIAIASHQLPFEFPQAVLDEASRWGDAIDPALADQRRDLRQVPLITIDGADARDFDDAVFAEPLDKGGYRVMVCIADVAEYVATQAELDVEAQKRGTSVYFPDRVVPMLPEQLSNGLCSLVPQQDRLCVCCEMRLDDKGKVISTRFSEAVMRSHARLTYRQVHQMVVAGDAELNERFAHVRSQLDALFEVYRKLSKKRAQRGALDFDSDQVYFEFGEDGQVTDIRPQSRNDAHRLIEELMILANVEAAKFVRRQDLPMLYRVHEPPQERKLEALEGFLKAEGIRKNWKDTPEPSQFAALQQRVKGTASDHLLNAVLLRSLSLAVYSPDNNGHFGLALTEYAHFTSPIRRYPDLLLHRAIKHAVRKMNPDQFPISSAAMAEFGRRCSFTERRAEEASRDVDERLKCQFMMRHLGDTFEGVITGVVGFGLFVELLDKGVSGLVHITALPEDYYDFDATSHRLIGKKQRRVFRLAERINVKVLGVNLEERKIDFEWVSDET
ncbi:MAG: ribonuclease R [Wenzhouxiangella sp.]|nr:ribonuclease R [Wenzhouxiangella sp.]